MTDDPNTVHIDRGNHPAGGWGAVKSTFKAYRQQAIATKVGTGLLRTNQPGSFDCPGCAFPDRPGKALVDTCEQGQKAVAWEMTRKAPGADFFAHRSMEQLRALSDCELESQGRLTEPLLYTEGSGHYTPIGWAQVFEIVGRELGALAPEQAAFYASGRSSNEAAFLWQLLARAWGCTNLPDSSNFCHEPSGHALKAAIGVGKGTCQLDDFEHADLIWVIGQNPATNHPRMMAALHEAARRGAKVVAINPLRERGFTNFSDPKAVGEMFTNRGNAVAHRIVQVRIGGDLALFKGVMKQLLELDAQARAGGSPRLIDEAFIAEHTTGFEAVAADLAAESWDLLVAESGVPRVQIDELARLYADAPATMATWCMGLTQHAHSVATIQTLTNLLLLRGNIGRRGAGAMPVRGHSNVQGDRTMGATSTMPARWLDNLTAEFPQAAISRSTGRDAAGVIDHLLAGDGQIQALLSLGGNFAVAGPDSIRVLAALSRCRFTLHIATKLNRTHCHPGQIGLLLPTLGRTDIDLQQGRPQMVSVEDSTSTVRSSRGIQAPLADTMMSEPAIVCGLGQTLLPGAGIDWTGMAGDYGLIRNHIEHVQRGLNDDFADFDRKLAEHGRFALTNSARERQWKTASGKAEFNVHPVPTAGPVARARQRHGAAVLALMTVRSHDQFNTTVYGPDDRYRGVFGGRRVVFMNAADLQALGLRDGQIVDLHGCNDEVSGGDGIERVVRGFKAVRYDIPPGCAAAYFPEATPLLAASNLSLHTRTPAYKDIPVMVRAAANPST